MRISVVIPCRDGEAFLGQTLDSVLNQTLVPCEVIVVDDGSTDGSLDVARRYGGIVRAVSRRAGGASAARNEGVALSRGDALMFLDADDLLGPTVLEALAAALDRHPEAVACCPWYRYEEVGGCWLAAPASCAPRRPGQDDLSAWLTGWYHPPCSVLWSRPAYERSGGWDPQVRVNTDGDVMMRGFIRGNVLVAAGGATAYYRRLPGETVSLSGTRLTRRGLESRLFVIDRIAAMLDGEGRLSRYRGPLGEAYETIARGCAGHPDLRERCLDAAVRVAGPSWRRGVRRVAARIAATSGEAARRLDGRLGRREGPAVAGTAGSRAGSRAALPASGPRPLVSVVIPTYDRAGLLPRALDSVLAQDYPEFEVLVVDDGSTDGTAGVVAGYGDPRIRYLRQDRNRGVAAARNRGLREARGDLIAFLDSDDEWLARKLSLQVALFAGGSRRLGLVYTGVESVAGPGGRTVELPAHRGDLHAGMLLRNLIHGGGSNAMIRASVVATVGYFDETLPAIEDYDYWLRIARFYEIDFIDEPLIRYHDQADPADGSGRLRRSLDFAANMEARRRFHARYGHEMRRAGVEHLFLLDSARRHLESPFGDAREARRLVLQALLARPGACVVYPWLLPGRIRRTLRPAVRRLRALLASRGRGGLHEESG
jgi:glycosyltransferase involved in cell wall biosynthesis